MTETAAIADVLLPAAQWGKKSGCFTNAGHTVHISLKTVERPRECKSDLDIFLDYARRMNFKGQGRERRASLDDVRGGVRGVEKGSTGRPWDYTGLSYEHLAGGSGIQWPCNKQNPQGTERLHTNGVFSHGGRVLRKLRA